MLVGGHRGGGGGGCCCCCCCRCTEVVSGPYGVSLWKSIRWEWETFSSYIQYEVGDGSRVKFWHDWW